MEGSEWTAKDIQKMSMAEYAAMRTAIYEKEKFRRTHLTMSNEVILLKQGYDYFREKWIATGDIDYLERMVERVNE